MMTNAELNERLREIVESTGSLLHPNDTMRVYGDTSQRKLITRICQLITQEVKAVAEWTVSGDTGISSEAILAYMTGVEPARWGFSPPADADDRGRCVRLLQKFPEWVPRLQEMTVIQPAGNSITITSKGIQPDMNSWARQVPLILAQLQASAPEGEKHGTN